MDLHSAFPISGRFIAVDGSSVTEAEIPFAVGMHVQNGAQIRFDWDDTLGLGLNFKDVFLGISSTDFALRFDGGYDDNFESGNGFFIFGGSSKPGSATGSGGFVDLRGGNAGFSSTGVGGKVILRGGNGGSGQNQGYVVVGDSGTVPNKFSLTSTDARRSLYVNKNLEVDGTTYLDGALNVVGTTTLATSLTGILKATSGVVATASSSDILAAIGTIDISSNTNLAVTSPITLIGDTVGFAFNTNNTWTGTNAFTSTVTLQTSLDGLATLTAGVVGELNGVQGDLVYYSGTNVPAVLNKNASATRYLSNTGASNNPAWAQVDLTNGVTGTLPAANLPLADDDAVTKGISTYVDNDFNVAAGVVSINQAGDFTWTGDSIWQGTQLFQTDVSLKDDVLFNIGDGGGGGGYVSLLNDSGTANIELRPFGAFAGVFYINDMGLTVEGNITVVDAVASAGPYLNIGDGALGAGYISMQMDTNGTGNMLVEPQGGFSGEVVFDTLSVTIQGNATVATTATNYLKVGINLAAPQATVNGDTHGIFVTKQETSTTGAIAGVFEAEYNNGSGASSSAIQACNLFTHTATGALSNLTATTQGGGLRSRALTRQRMTGTIAQMSCYSLNLTQDVSTGTVSLGTPLNIEAPIIGLGSTMTEFRGINFETAAVSGTLVTAKYLHMPSLGGGTNRYEAWWDTDAGAFFREAGNQIYSSAGSTLDIDVTTTLNFRVGTAIEATIAANKLTFNNGVTDSVLDWTNSGVLEVQVGHMLWATTNEARFRDSGQRVFSSKASTLDLDGASEIQFLIGGTEEASLTSSGFRVTDKLSVGTLTISPRLYVLEATIGNEVQRLESTATNSDPRESVYQNRTATTDATVTTLHTFTVPASTTYAIEAWVIARRTGGASGTAEDGARYHLQGTYKNVAGTATLIGVVTKLADEDQAGWDATFDVTSDTVRCRVTGAASNDVTWHMTARTWQLST